MKSPYEPPQSDPGENKEYRKKIDSPNPKRISNRRMIVIALLLSLPLLLIIFKLASTMR